MEVCMSMFKRTVSITLVIAMLLSYLPGIPAYGEDDVVESLLLDEKNDYDCILEDMDWLSSYIYSSWAEGGYVRNDLYLPLSPNGSMITFESSDEDLIGIDGKITQPSFSTVYESDVGKSITFTAILAMGEISLRKDFEDIRVYPLHPSDEEILGYQMHSLMSESYFNNGVLNGNNINNVKTNLNLYNSMSQTYWMDIRVPGVDITWHSSHPDVISTDGTVTRPEKGESSVEVKLTAILQYNGLSLTQDFTVTVTPREDFVLSVNYNDFSDTSLLNLNGNVNIINSIDGNGNDVKALQFKSGDVTTGSSIFTKNKLQLDEDLSFSTAFCYRLLERGSYNPGESSEFTFTLQPIGNDIYPDALDNEILSPSFNIVFHGTYYKPSSGGQGAHTVLNTSMELFFNGKYIDRTDGQLISTFTPGTIQYFNVWMEYDGNILKVWATPSTNRPAPSYMHMEKEINLAEIFLDADDELTLEDVREVYAGFTSSYGNAPHNVEIYNWYFKNDSVPIDKDTYDYSEISNINLTAIPAGLQSTITATVSNSYGFVKGTMVNFSTDFGSFDELDKTTAITDENGKATVTLNAPYAGTANVKAVVKGGAMAKASTSFTVSDEDCVDFDRLWLTDGEGFTQLLNGNSTADNISSTLNFPSTGLHGSTITWTSSSPHINAENGTVTLPTPEEGNQAVTLTAEIKKGEAIRTYNINLVVRVPDESAVYKDREWLKEEELLNGNSSLNEVTNNLTLPSMGYYGSNISWISSNIEIISLDGTVTRTAFTEGDKNVTLTALIKKNTTELNKEFIVTVKSLDPTNKESVIYDSNNLTIDTILNENEGPDNIQKDLTLPVKGEKGSDISWSSSDEVTINLQGKVTIPAHSAGNKKVTVTALIKKGEETIEKSFELTVVTLPQTDEEAVDEDVNLLSISTTLHQNLSEFAVTNDLILPSVGLNGSMITWTSDNEGVISSTGKVSRPGHTQGHKKVTLTAVFEKGEIIKSKEYTYTVLAEPDITPPALTEIRVISGNTIKKRYTDIAKEIILPWDTDRIVLQFDELLEYIPTREMAKIEGIDVPGHYIGSYNDTLYVSLYGQLKPEEEYLIIIPAVKIADKFENIPDNELRIKVTVEEKLTRDITISSSTISNQQKDVPTSVNSVTLQFNTNDVATGENHDGIKLREKGGRHNIPTYRYKDGGKVSVAFREPLYAGFVYELYIPAGVVKDDYGNKNAEETITFRTENYKSEYNVVEVYPSNKQKDVNINQRIEILFDSYYWGFPTDSPNLSDSNGNEIGFYLEKLKGMANGIVLTPHKPLQPNTTYTLTGKYNDSSSSSADYFSITFTTGADELNIRSISPSYGIGMAPVTGLIEMEFSNFVNRGPNFDAIIYKDSNGETVTFQSEENGNKVTLRPTSPLKDLEYYTVIIPSGAYVNLDGKLNDSYTTYFKTSEKLKLDADMITSLSSWVKGRPVQFDTQKLEMALVSAGHKDISYSWNFGDGNSSNEKNPSHAFNTKGNYTVSLDVQDDKGYQYSLERNIFIYGLENVEMTVSVDNPGIIYYAPDSYHGMPVRNYSIRLQCQDAFLHGETMGVKLYKGGKLLKDYGSVTAGINDKAYNFKFEPEVGYNGNYELVFTYQRPGGELTLREKVSVKNMYDTSFLRVQLIDRFNGTVYSEASYLTFVIDGVEKRAEKEYIPSLGEYVYTVKEQFGTLRYYNRIVVKETGNTDSIYNVGNLGDFYDRPHIIEIDVPKAGSMSLSTITCDLETDLEYYLIEGADVGTVTYTLTGNWSGFEPGYFEMKTNNGRYIQKSESGKFTFKPGDVLKAGEVLMFRMVSKNGVPSLWKFYGNKVIPRPTILGKKADIKLVDGIYEVYLNAPLPSAIGSSIDVLDGVPFLDGGDFGVDGGLPLFVGTLFLVPGANPITAEMDFSGSAGFEGISKSSKSIEKKKTADKKLSTANKKTSPLKKIKSVGYDFEIDMNGYLGYYYDWSTETWNVDYFGVNVDGMLAKTRTVGYSLYGIIGLEGYFTMELYAGTRLRLNNVNTSNEEYEGIFLIRPGARAGITGSYGIGKINGELSAFIPAEIHYPTGYIGAGLDVNVKVVNTIFYLVGSSTDTLYEKELYSVHWDNGKEKVVIRSMAPPIFGIDESFTDESDYTLITRNYLNRESEWMAQDSATATLMRFKALDDDMSSIEISDRMLNVYPNAELQLVQNGDNKWLVWIDDNPLRDDLNRTQLRYSTLKNGIWAEPQWIFEDTTADLSISAAAVTNGMLIAWQDAGENISAEDPIADIINNSEIYVSKDGYLSYNGSSEYIKLTDDSKLDHSPRLAADGNKAILVWTKSQGLKVPFNTSQDYMSPPNSDSIHYAVWDGSSWGEAASLQENMPTVIDSYVAMHEDETILLYTVDMDDDFSTTNDKEVFACTYNGSEWSEALQITDNNVMDKSPKAVYLNGEWFITWIQEGNLIYKSGLNGKEIINDTLESVHDNYEITVNKSSESMAAIVYATYGADSSGGITAAFYDAGKGIWSYEVMMSEEGDTKSISSVFTKDGKLNAAYISAEIFTESVPVIIDGATQFSEIIKTSDKADLKMLEYTPNHNLFLHKEYGIVLEPNIPVPDTMATAHVTVSNNGDFAEDAVVELYDDEPDKGGKLLASSTTGIIPGHSSMVVELEWLVPEEEKSEYNLYATIHQDTNFKRSVEYGSISTKVSAADISLTAVTQTNLAENNYIITSELMNDGSITLEDVNVRLVDTETDRIVDSINFKKIEAGQILPLSFLIQETDLLTLRLEAILQEGVTDNYPDNNYYEFMLEPKNIVIDSISPASGETQVDIKTDISVKFNMDVSQGVGFTGIELMDLEFNKIPIIKSLIDRTLVVKPLNPLSRDMEYTLTIPRDAISDSYGHGMESSYSMNFTTVSNSPEIIFTWPGNGMEEVGVNEDIRIKYNQSITTGPEYGKIVLRDSNNNVISAVVTINGEWLIIKPSSSLKGKTRYVLTIPRGAVMSFDNIAQNNDCLLSFTTAVGTSKPGDGDNSNGVDKRPVSSQNISVMINGNKIDFPNIITGDKVTFMYTPTATELINPECIVVWYTDEAGNSIYIPDGRFNPETGMITFTASDSTSYEVGFNKINFNDVNENSWYYKAVNFIAARNITTGTGNGNYSSMNNITRGDFLVLIMRAYRITPNKYPENNFSDAGNTYYTGYLAAAKRLGITAGIGENLYAPSKEITRQEMFTMIYNILLKLNKLPQSNLQQNITEFEDVDEISSWATDAVSMLVKAGVVSGSGGMINPSNNASRAEMAQLLYNLLNQ